MMMMMMMMMMKKKKKKTILVAVTLIAQIQGSLLRELNIFRTKIKVLPHNNCHNLCS